MTHFIYTAIHATFISFRYTKSTKSLFSNIMGPRSYPNTSSVMRKKIMLVSSNILSCAATTFDDLFLLYLHEVMM